MFFIEYLRQDISIRHIWVFVFFLKSFFKYRQKQNFFSTLHIMYVFQKNKFMYTSRILKKRFQKEKKYLTYKFFIFNLPLPPSQKTKQIPGYWSTPDSALDRFKSIGPYIFMKNFPKFFKAFGLPGLERQALEFVFCFNF